MNECEQFTGRKREICRGDADIPLNGPNSINAYRARWGLPPLSLDEHNAVVTGEALPPKPLSLMQRASSMARVMTSTAINKVTAGSAMVSEEVREQRLQICKACEHFQDDHCKICGCSCNKNKSLLNKLAHSSSRCPLNPPKWGPVPIERAKGQQKASRNPFAFASSDTVPTYITTARLMDDARLLASRLPSDTGMIVGVARSGLCVATMISMLLHRPLMIFRQSSYDMVPAGNGWRLTGNVGGQGRVVVIDDTVMSGNSFKFVMPVVRQTFPEALSAAVYVNPAARHKPDLWVHDLPHPHLLEWNLPNSIFSPHTAVDFDGILCHDCPRGSDDDGERYAEFLKNAPPLYLTRKTPIPLIVTARLEKYRPQTVDWLFRHGVTFRKLVMGPWSNLAQRAKADIAVFKAEHFKQFLKQRHAIQPPLFVESEPHLAARIAQLAGGIVVCPAAGRCFH